MEKRIQRIYVDSSAVGGKFNTRVAEQTKPFWDAVERGEFVVIASDVLDDELAGAPKRVQDFFYGLPQTSIERVISTDESDDLAEKYIAEGVVSESSLADCKHIALATLTGADALVSWNFRHMIYRRAGYNDVNEKLGYPRITIQTPEKLMEVSYDET